MYQRKRAIAYAHYYWRHPNTTFRYFGDNDCANYVSQCIMEGGFPMEVTNKRSSGWWYKGPNDNWSYSWTVVEAFYYYVKQNRTDGLRAHEKETPNKLQLGDVICYDWNGNGNWDHNAIVVAFDHDLNVLVDAHSNSSFYRNWDFKDSDAWTPQTKYAFLHIIS